MSSTYLLNLLNIDVASAASSVLIDLVTIWRNLRVLKKFAETALIAFNGRIGANTKNIINWIRKFCPSIDMFVLALGQRSAIKLNNAKAEPHRVFARAREHKDDDDDDADGDDADGSGAN
jgi:hypothetical protein